MKNFILCFMSAVALVAIASCSPDKKTIAMTDTPSISDPGDSNLDILTSPLYVQLSGRWEGSQGAFSLIDTCQIPANTPPGTLANCTFVVPEAQLYYSDIKFTLGSTVNSTCSLVSFFPYQYRRSNAVDYIPRGTSKAIVCDPSNIAYTDDPKCYGGAASQIVPSFPYNRGIYFLKSVTTRQSYVVPAENTLRWYGGHSVNYLIANDLSDRATPIASGAKAYVADSFVDYWIECADIWGEPQYQIKLIIKDEDLDETDSDPAWDQFTDWDN